MDAWEYDEQVAKPISSAEIETLVKAGLKPKSMDIGGGTMSAMKLAPPECAPCALVRAPQVKKPTGWVLKNGNFVKLTWHYHPEAK